jgi:hypothetical protein
MTDAQKSDNKKWDNKKAEQKTVDDFFDEKISLYTMTMAMIEYQKHRGLKKLYLYDPAPTEDIRSLKRFI